ncbi:hypothetical protein, partial [Massilia antarctica]|uniref:hypothetical protein n=1 Tax=Massilia antarctica TaxID=2765360 RepID=UPI0035E7299B
IARDIVIVTEKLMDRRTGTAAAVYETFRLGRRSLACCGLRCICPEPWHPDRPASTRTTGEVGDSGVTILDLSRHPSWRVSKE